MISSFGKIKICDAVRQSFKTFHSVTSLFHSLLSTLPLALSIIHAPPCQSVSEPTITFNSIATPIFASAPTFLLTYSPPVTSITITHNTPPLKTTDVAFETAAPTYVPQMALNATVDSYVACHVLGMVCDPGINLSMDSATRNMCLHPNFSFCHFLLQFTFNTPFCCLHILCHCRFDVTPHHSTLYLLPSLV